MIEFAEHMAAFSFRQHQDFVTYSKNLERYGYTLEDVIKFVNAGKDEVNNAYYKSRIKNQRCPECKGLMFLYPVNFNEASQTGDPTDKSVWLCRNLKCQETIYNKKTIREIRGGN